MSPNPATSLQGTDANGAAQRLGNLIDQILAAVPSVVVLVGKIPQNGNPTQNSNTNAYNALIPGVVNARASAGKHVRLVDFSVIGVVSSYVHTLLPIDENAHEAAEHAR